MFYIDTDTGREEGESKRSQNACERQAQEYSREISGNAANVESLKGSMSEKLGVDCFDMKIRRSSGGSRYGYAQHGQITLSNSLNLESLLGKRVLGHEMVHAAQQLKTGEEKGAPLLKAPPGEALGFFDCTMDPYPDDAEYTALCSLYHGLKAGRRLEYLDACLGAAVRFLGKNDMSSVEALGKWAAVGLIRQELEPVCLATQALIDGVVQFKSHPCEMGLTHLKGVWDRFRRDVPRELCSWDQIYEANLFASNTVSSFGEYDSIIKWMAGGLLGTEISSVGSKELDALFDELREAFRCLLRFQPDSSQKTSRAQTVLYQLSYRISSVNLRTVHFWHGKLRELLRMLGDTANEEGTDFSQDNEGSSVLSGKDLHQLQFSPGKVKRKTLMWDYNFNVQKNIYQKTRKPVSPLNEGDMVRVIISGTVVPGDFLMVLLKDNRCGLVAGHDIDLYMVRNPVSDPFRYPEEVKGECAFDTESADPFLMAVMQFVRPAEKTAAFPDLIPELYDSPQIRLMYTYASRIYAQTLIRHRMDFVEKCRAYMEEYRTQKLDPEQYWKAFNAAELYRLYEPHDLEKFLVSLGSLGGFVIGEAHSDKSSRLFVMKAMPLLKAAGINTIYVEEFVWEDVQWLINLYMSGTSLELPELLKRLSLFPDYAPLDTLLYQAKLYGIRVLSLSAMNANKGTDTDEKKVIRAATMNYSAKTIVENDAVNRGGMGYIILTGTAHVHFHEDTRGRLMPGLSEILQIPAITIENRSVSFSPPFEVTAMNGAHREMTREERDQLI